MTFSGRIAIVAGGNGALGRAVALAFLESGARVVATARRTEGIDALAAAAGGARDRLEPAALDAADPAAAERLVEDVIEAHGRVDALVNATGAWEGGAPVWETDPERYRRMLAANLDTTFALARAVLPPMIRQHGGAVVAVASRAAQGGQAGAAAYAAAKAGVLALVASIAEEVRGRGIRVNAVVPDVIDTPANRAAMPGANVARWVRPEAIARVILFLCSSEAAPVHGAAVPVGGAG